MKLFRISALLAATIAPALSLAQMPLPLVMFNETNHPITVIEPSPGDDASPHTYRIAPKKFAITLMSHSNYYRVEQAKTGGTASAFLGVEMKGSKMKIHGYIASGLGYSYNGELTDSGHVYFCSPEVYSKNGSCKPNA